MIMINGNSKYKIASKSPTENDSDIKIDASVQTEYSSSPKSFELLFNTSRHPMLIIDMNVNFIKAKPHLLNPAARLLVNSCNNDFYTGSYMEKFDASLSDFISSMKTKVAHPISYTDIIRIPNSVGTKAIYEFSSTIFDVNSQQRELAIVLIEISKTIEEEINAVENFKESLMSALSHELNNPMNSLIPIFEMLSSPSGDMNFNELKDVALSNIYILQHKLQDLMDYASMQINDIKLELSEFCVNDLFDKLKEMFKVEVDHKFNELKLEIKNFVSKRMVILGDKNRLEQILIKLISNANKFTAHGTIKLTAEANVKNFNVRFIISDTGIGISKDKQERLFAPLNQNNKGNNKYAKLLGLGLAIAKGLCKCMESKLNVKSEEGKGTKFDFEIPMCLISNFEDLTKTNLEEEKVYRKPSFFTVNKECKLVLRIIGKSFKTLKADSTANIHSKTNNKAKLGI